LKTKLADIEPFTIVLFESGNLYECRWDGSQKYCMEKDGRKAWIWSSAMCFGDEQTKKNENLFYNWLNKKGNQIHNSMIDLHRMLNSASQADEVLLDAKKIGTGSITAIELGEEETTMKHFDVSTNKMHITKIKLGAMTIQY
jgi:hypothetical protein